MGLLSTARFILQHPIGQRAPLRSLGDWVKWQVGSRILPGPAILSWVGGTRLIVAPGMTGATGNLYVGLHEIEEMAFALHLLRPGDLMLDVGANIGSYTVLAAGAAGATVHAFEPVATSHARLADNVRLNGLEARVTLHAVAVGAEDGEMRMEVDQDTTNRVLKSAETSSNATALVPVAALDSLFPDAHPVFIKIDVEGFEAAVLDGARAILGRTMAVVSEVSKHGERVFAAFAAAGLHPVRYEPFSRRLVPLATPACNERGNTLWLRDLDWAADRLRQAPRYTVKGLTL